MSGFWLIMAVFLLDIEKSPAIAGFRRVLYGLCMQIDHDPRELSHKALKIVALVTLVVTVAIAIPVVFSVRWAVDQLPIPLLALLVGSLAGMCAGFWIGRWDALRGQRIPGRDG